MTDEFDHLTGQLYSADEWRSLMRHVLVEVDDFELCSRAYWALADRYVQKVVESGDENR